MKGINDNMLEKMHSFYTELQLQLESSKEFTRFYNLYYMDYQVMKISVELYDQLIHVRTTRALLVES